MRSFFFKQFTDLCYITLQDLTQAKHTRPYEPLLSAFFVTLSYTTGTITNSHVDCQIYSPLYTEQSFIVQILFFLTVTPCFGQLTEPTDYIWKTKFIFFFLFSRNDGGWLHVGLLG